ncbi:hypothetical protein Y032_0291g1570 [Ancylostoma ceylanicum]|uniref:Uncharacterized protein n=1 Tax=Ancylostoma ceylanicum TaxID=53326 RepID=A0A016S556_9BILA|nr:hypothetical protein Y032_0291g1570 [Ancylostoma ceylanicum]
MAMFQDHLHNSKLIQTNKMFGRLGSLQQKVDATEIDRAWYHRGDRNDLLGCLQFSHVLHWMQSVGVPLPAS